MELVQSYVIQKASLDDNCDRIAIDFFPIFYRTIVCRFCTGTFNEFFVALFEKNIGRIILYDISVHSELHA